MAPTQPRSNSHRQCNEDHLCRRVAARGELAHEAAQLLLPQKTWLAPAGPLGCCIGDREGLAEEPVQLRWDPKGSCAASWASPWHQLSDQVGPAGPRLQSHARSSVQPSMPQPGRVQGAHAPRSCCAAAQPHSPPWPTSCAACTPPSCCWWAAAGLRRARCAQAAWKGRAACERVCMLGAGCVWVRPGAVGGDCCVRTPLQASFGAAAFTCPPAAPPAVAAAGPAVCCARHHYSRQPSRHRGWVGLRARCPLLACCACWLPGEHHALCSSLLSFLLCLTGCLITAC